MAEVGILIIDDNVASQRALKLVLDSEGWRVRIVAHAPHALAELATGNWNLAIVNVALLDMKGPVFVTLRELAQADAVPSEPVGERQPGQPVGRCLRALFLVPLVGSREVPLLLEREGLPYVFKPYHLHDFLQKVSDLLQESGAIDEPLRGLEGFASRKRRRPAREPHRSKKMFASREDYQMTEEEIAEFEREEAERKKQASEPPKRDSF